MQWLSIGLFGITQAWLLLNWSLVFNTGATRAAESVSARGDSVVMRAIEFSMLRKRLSMEPITFAKWFTELASAFIFCSIVVKKREHCGCWSGWWFSWLEAVPDVWLCWFWAGSARGRVNDFELNDLVVRRLAPGLVEEVTMEAGGGIWLRTGIAKWFFTCTGIFGTVTSLGDSLAATLFAP